MSSVDYLIDESGELSQFKDMETINRREQIERLPEYDKEHILSVIYALLRDAAMRKAYIKKIPLNV